MRIVPFLVFAALIASPSSAAPKQWLPAGKWAFDTKGERCAAAHGFRSGNKLVTLGFSLRPMSDGVTLLFEVPGQVMGIKIEDAKLRIGDRRLPQDSGTAGPSSKPRHILYEFNVSRSQLAELAGAQRLSLNTPRFDADLPVTGWTGAEATLQQCLSNLLARWGLSKEDQSRIVQNPAPERNLHTYVSDIDYPDGAVLRRAVGMIEARVMVAADGTPSDCHIVKSSGHADLDAMTCKVAVRPKFKPAIDREGKPMASPYYFKISWLMAH